MASSALSSTVRSFQHAAARRRLILFAVGINRRSKFQHAAARRRLIKGFASGAWEGMKGFVGVGAGPATGVAPTVGPARLAPAAMGAARPNLVNTTNVNVTVPTGTTAEQVRVLNSAANKAFRETSDRKFARDAAIYAR